MPANAAVYERDPLSKTETSLKQTGWQNLCIAIALKQCCNACCNVFPQLFTFLPTHLSCCTVGIKVISTNCTLEKSLIPGWNFTIIMHYNYVLLPIYTSNYANSLPGTITIYIWNISLPFFTEISARFVFIRVDLPAGTLTLISLIACTHANRGSTHVTVFTHWNSSQYVQSQLLNKDRI